MKLEAVLLTAFLLVSLVATSWVQIPAVKAQEPFYELTISVDEAFYLHGETVKATVHSNASMLVGLNIYDSSETVVFSGDKVTNGTGFAVWNLPVAEAMAYGKYTFKANVTSCVSETWATILDVSGWTQTSFPYEKTWKGINYTLKARGFIAEGFDSTLNITLPYFDWYSSLTVKAYENSMCLLERITHEASGLKVDLTYAFIHSGLKIIINGSIPEPTKFTFKFVSPKAIKKHLDSLKSGHLCFDWSDMRKAKQAFTYNKTSHKLTVIIPKSFRIDPYIFEDGFESGDFSAWTSTAGTPAVVSTQKKSGTYSAEFDATTKYATKSFANQLTLFTRLYLRFNALPADSSWTKYEFLRFRDNTGGAGVISRLETRQRGGTDTHLTLWYYYPSESTDYLWEPSVDTWYCIEQKFVVDAVNGEYRVWIDDVEVITATGLDTSGANYVNMIRVGQIASDYTVTDWIDCVVVDSSYIGTISEEEEYEYNLTGAVQPSGNLDYDAEKDYMQTETVQPTDALSAIGEALYTIPNTITPIAAILFLKEIIVWITHIVTVTPVMNMQKEIAVQLFELAETVNPQAALTWLTEKLFIPSITFTINDALEFGKETLEQLYEFLETVKPMDALSKTLEGLAGVEISVLSVSFAIIAIGIAFAALAIAIKRREGEE